MHIPEVIRFADYFFDGLIMDWIVQSRISSSLDAVLEAQVKIQAILNALVTQHQGATYQVERLSMEREHLIRNAG